VECTKIEELLSEYIDDLLDTQTRKLVDVHLQSCPACHKTLEELKSLVRDLGAFEPVLAPPDFLDKVHQRLFKRSWARRIFDTLFVPPLVKLPLQFAAVAIMAVLVITISYRIKPEIEVTRRSTETSQKKVVSESAGDTYAHKPMKQNQPKSAVSEENQIVQDNQIIEFALLVNQVPKESVQDEKLRSLERSKKEESPAIHSPAPPAALKQRELKLSLQKNEVKRAKPDEEAFRDIDSNWVFGEIQSLTNRLQGTIIESTYDKDPSYTQKTMTVRIPFTSYNQFLEALKQLGTLQPSVPVNVTGKDDKTITIRIRLVALD
jgi:hypothetical protein